MTRSLYARPTAAAGDSWRKWSARWSTDVRMQPWWAFRSGMVGFWLVFASLGALAALLVAR